MSSATRNIKSLGALRGFAVLPKSINTWRSSVLFAFSRYSKLRRKQSPNPTWYARRVSLEGFDLLVSLLTLAAEVEPFIVFLDRVRSRPLFVFDVSAIDASPLRSEERRVGKECSSWCLRYLLIEGEMVT